MKNYTIRMGKMDDELFKKIGKRLVTMKPGDQVVIAAKFNGELPVAPFTQICVRYNSLQFDEGALVRKGMGEVSPLLVELGSLAMQSERCVNIRDITLNGANSGRMEFVSVFLQTEQSTNHHWKTL